MIDNDNKTEEMIQAAGKTAPRLTPTSIKAVIASEHYFTAADGVAGQVDDGQAGDVLASLPESMKLLTFCVLVLKNGFTVTGKSACAIPENFYANIGRKVAFDDAFNQIWPLEGYLLKQHLFEVSNTPPALQSDKPAHQQRVIVEHVELLERANNLAAFLVTPTFERLPDEEQGRLRDQVEYMVGYARILSERIAAFPQ